MLFDESKFKTKKELFAFLIENKETLITQKKSELKKADGISVLSLPGVGMTNKAVDVKDSISVKAVINTTNVIDSHSDLHIHGLWDKSLRENRRVMHLQEHTMSFKSIIADGEDLKAYTQDFTWKELGYDMEGNTQALVFDSNVKENRNSYMFKEYKQGHVNNHSVGMIYVKLRLAVNDEDYEVEKGVWDKYAPMVSNKEALEKGYFWAVLEAKVVEGSAVPIGSNSFTPTLQAKEPEQSTQYIEPLKDTLTREELKSTIKEIFKNGIN